ncbi:uncharacterized protein LOC129965953 [Argiope bruennichi]|uniref:uncharacterized protein LOC129965953 n=1 Tax=Argiope bruennichi TaxID=94029 RepID=UPI00249586D2|nr:uncharacterized protein LOC129965953 [Argiope bruennichi]
MIETRNSKRLAGKQSVDPTAKCNGASLNENIKESKRNQNRICKQKLQGNKKENDLRDKGKKGKDIVSDKTSATKNICSNSTIRSSVRLIENKSNLQKLKIDESEKIKKVLNSKRNIKVDKENNLPENKISVPNPSKELKTNINSIRKITKNFPLKTISDNAVSHVPIWAVDKNLPKKQTEKRASDIYNIEKDEDLMNELSPVKKKKKTAVKKPQVIRNKIFSKKTLSSLTSHKNVFLSTKEAKPARQLKCEGWNMIKTNPAEPTLHTVDKHEILGTASILKSTDPVLESVDSIMESAIKNTGIPTATNEIVIESNTKTQEKGEKYVEDCITDCYSSFVNIDTSDISFGKSVAKCLDKSVNNNMTPDKQSNQSVVKMNHYVEDCIDECYASFMNMDTSLRESVEKDKTKVSRIDMTPDKTNSKNVKMSKNSPGRQIFLIPKMTSTPENGDNPVIQTVKHQSKNCGLLLSEMSAIPCTVSRNIQLELSEIEISPIKASLNNQETSLYESPSEENKNSKNVICLSVEAKNAIDSKEKASVKVCEKNLPVKSSNLSKVSTKENCMKTKNSRGDADTLLQKENAENAALPKLGYKRKGPVSPLKPIQVNSVCNNILLSVDGNEGVLPSHKSDKNLGKTRQKHTQSKKIATKSVSNIANSSENPEEKSDSSFYKIALFESPEKEETGIEKAKHFSPVKKVKKHIFNKETVSSPIKDDNHFKVLKPVNCYQSPHHSKRLKSRTKVTHDEQKKTKHVKEADCQPKKQASRTKATHGEKRKAKELEEKAEKLDELIESLNQHFSELENMELCFE